MAGSVLSVTADTDGRLRSTDSQAVLESTPMLTCSARIPVFAMLTALLFPRQPLRAALAFTGAYALGIVATLGMAAVFKRTILAGETRPLILELPGYKLPRVRIRCFQDKRLSRDD